MKLEEGNEIRLLVNNPPNFNPVNEYKVIKCFEGEYYDLQTLHPPFDYLNDFFPVLLSVHLNSNNYEILKTKKRINMYIQNEDILKLEPINGWKCSQDPMSGTIAWDKEGSNVTYFATPNWEDFGIVPIDKYFEDSENDYEKIDVIELYGLSLKIQLETYVHVMTSILK